MALQRLTFATYQPERDGQPSPDALALEWPIDILGDLAYKEALIRQTGFDPAADPYLGMLREPWNGHPPDALVVAHAAGFPTHHPFAVSKEGFEYPPRPTPW